MYIKEVPERKKKKERNEEKAMFEAPVLKNDMNLEIETTLRMPSKKNKNKSISRYILASIGNEEESHLCSLSLISVFPLFFEPTLIRLLPLPTPSKLLLTDSVMCQPEPQKELTPQPLEMYHK